MNKFYFAAMSAAFCLSASFQTNAQVITDPAGERTVYSRSSLSVLPMGDTPMETEEYGFAGVLVYGDNGEVYLRNPFSQFVTGTYLEGVTTNNPDGAETLTFELPQQITVYEEEGESYDLFACMLAFSEDGESIETAESQTLEFINKDRGWVMTDQQTFLGLTFDDSSWTGFAEMNMVYEPIKETAAEVPDGLEFKPWMMTYGNEGHYVDVAIDGDKCYVKNFLDTSEKSLAPIVGTISDSGISFNSPQYLGVNEDNSYLTYFYGGEIRKTFIEEINSTVTSFIPAEEMTFELQGDGKYKSSQSAMFTPFTDIENEYFWSIGLYEEPALSESVSHDFTPANPSVVDYRYYSNYGFGYVSFEIPMLNVEGQILNSSNLYYNIYLDGELLEFSPDEYPLLKESITDIPYDFEDGKSGSGDIKIEGSKHTIILYRDGLDEVGIQSFYLDDSGYKYCSELVTADTAGKETLVSQHIAEEIYIDFAGSKVQKPDKGMYILLTKFTDGSIVAKKILIR